MAWIVKLPPTPRHPQTRWQVRYRDGTTQRSAGIYPTKAEARSIKRAVEQGDHVAISDRNCSGGCCGWQPWVALKQPAQGDQRVDAVLARGRHVGAHGQKRLRAVQGPPAPGNLLLQLDHADVALGQIIGRWDPQVLQEPQDLATVGVQPLQQASSW